MSRLADQRAAVSYGEAMRASPGGRPSPPSDCFSRRLTTSRPPVQFPYGGDDVGGAGALLAPGPEQPGFDQPGQQHIQRPLLQGVFDYRYSRSWPVLAELPQTGTVIVR